MHCKVLAPGLIVFVASLFALSPPTAAQPATPPAIHVEPEPSVDVFSDSVGASAAQFRVDEAGAASYSVPIYVPPGTAGVAPQVELSYGSRNPTGPMGPGWAISGLSSVARCKATIESGDVGALADVPINFDDDPSNDAYCLDGQRLYPVGSGLGSGVLACPSAGGATGQQFAPELDTGIRVCGYTAGANALGFSMWLVQGRDGSIRRYGATDNARLAPLDGAGTALPQHTLQWSLDRTVDSAGNALVFTYIRDNVAGETHIAEIGYTARFTTGDPLNALQTRAPYNRVAFNYLTLPDASKRLDFIAGARRTLSKQLISVEVFGAVNNGGNPNTETLVRRYTPTYQSALQGTRLARLIALRECAPSGVGDVCYPETRFDWLYPGGNFAEGFTSTTATSSNYSQLFNYSVDSRTADINGDGRQDLVWIKDRDCPGNGADGTTATDPLRFRVMISFGGSAGLGPPVSANAFVRAFNPPAGCGVVPTAPPDVSGLYHLYDFTGDGREDLLVGDTATWKIHPTVQQAGQWVFRQTPIDTGIPSPTPDTREARLADFNGDGLPDLLHAVGTPGAETAALRFMERVPTSEPGELTFRFASIDVDVEFQLNEPANNVTYQAVYPRGGQGADLNGDGRGDIMVLLTRPIEPGQSAVTPRPVTRDRLLAPTSGPFPPITIRSSVLINEGINAMGRMVLREEAIIASIDPEEAYAFSVTARLADLNGDSLADVLYQCSEVIAGNNCQGEHADFDQSFYFRLNTGSHAAGQRFAPAIYSGFTLPNTRAERVQLLDVNGDQRLDLLYQDDLGSGSARYPLMARLWRVTDSGGVLTQSFSPASAAAFGSAATTIAQQNPEQYNVLYLDVSGDGAIDALRFKVDNTSTGNVYLVKSAMNFGGNDFITAITNGLGARTEVNYGSLVYSDLYTRAFDGPAKIWGRGSPVFDVFGALWAVQRVRSSAPTPVVAIINSGPDAMSLVVYRYRGARMQSGGRGFLGFSAVVSEDRQTFIRSTTEYRQDYPFLGRPAHTWAETFPPSEVADESCQLNPDHPSCIVEPPDCGIRPVPECVPNRFALGINPPLSDATSTYQARPTFNPLVKAPMVVVQTGTVEQKFDLDTPGAFSHSIVSDFSYDDFGNLMGTTAIHSAENASAQLVEVSREISVNVYGCKPQFSPPLRSNCGPNLPQNQDDELRRLARVSLSAVVMIRPGEELIVRRSSFEYDATTRQLISEIQGPYDDLKPDEGLRELIEMRTDHQLDSNGNRTLTVKCSIAHYANRSACLNLAGLQQRQWEATPSRFQRYARTEYDALGRFVTGTRAPFFGSAGNGLSEAYAGRVGVTLSGALDRNAHGDPLSAISAHGVASIKRYGVLGREQFMRGDTGGFSRTVYTWCADVLNAGISASAPRANCPVGAVFRVMTDSTATSGGENGRAIAPRAYAYFDKLGREMLTTTRIYQAASEDPGLLSRWSSVATRFDALGRAQSSTVPYFSLDPESTQTLTNRAGTSVSGLVPAQSAATFDALSRTRAQTLPEQPVNGASSASISYSKLQSTATNPRNFLSIRQKNAMGEVVSAIDSEGFEVDYAFEAAGNLKSVTRTPSNGSSAGQTLTTSMTYDRLGRKIAMDDPDKGSWTYQYNALGDLIKQVDAKGQTQRLYYDAMGRMWKRTEDRASSGSFVAEPTSTFVYDTANLGATSNKAVGLLAEESNTTGGFSRSYRYDGFGRGVGVTSNLEGNVFHQRVTFDAFGRPFQSFDPSIDSNSNAGTMIEYSQDGFPIRVREAASGFIGTVYQEILTLDQRSQVRKERLGESANLTTIRTYDDATGRLITINTGNNGNGALQRWDHTFDKHGNLTSRWNRAGVGSTFDLKEDFAYDSLDRLDTVTLTRFNGTSPNAISLDLGYDQLGNVLSKSGLGNYGYGSGQIGCSAGPHAVTSLGNRSYCYDENGNQTIKRVNGTGVRTIKYTGFDMAEEIVRTEGSINAFVSFKYAPDRARWKRVDGGIDADGCAANDGLFCNGMEDGAPLSTSNQTVTYYVGNIEHITRGGITEVKRYVGGYLVISSVGIAPPSFKYLLRDVLGSVDVVTDAGGLALQRMSFDAHGSRRNADPIGAANLWGLLSSAQAASFNSSTTTRGFTGHEQLDQTGLVHMNGRIYDPELGRFIQADPMVEPSATQGLNRYTYVLNNPLSATDPSGYLTFRQIVGIAIAVVAAFYGQYYLISNPALSLGIVVAGGFVSAYVATGSLQAGFWGAFSAAVFWGIGTSFTKAVPGADGTATLVTTGTRAAKVAAHASAGGVLTVLQGGKFGHGFASAGITEVLSPAIGQVGGGGMKGIATRAALSAALGGTVSKVTGGKFANGAATSAFASLFNAAVHEATKPRALLMVGDPGLGDHNANRAFDLAAETEASALQKAGWDTETVRVSSVDDIRSALTTGVAIDRAYYFGHAGASGLAVGEQAGAGTNLFADDAATLGPGRMTTNAEFYIYGCNAGRGSSNIANTLSYYLRRPTYGFSSGMHYTGNSGYNPAPPYLKPPNGTPFYLRPDNGLPATKFDSYNSGE